MIAVRVLERVVFMCLTVIVGFVLLSPLIAAFLPALMLGVLK